MSTHKYTRPSRSDAFEIAIICALTLEADAVLALFDEYWDQDEQYEVAEGDTNSYTIGRIAHHHVVLIHMPSMGKVSAASVAVNLQASFPRIRLGLLVGVCGSVPFIDNGTREIVLGDIIVSTQIVQTDFGRQYSNGFDRKDTLQDNLGRPSLEVRGFLAKLQGEKARVDIEKDIQTQCAKVSGVDGNEGSKYPGATEDHLFESEYRHKHQGVGECETCDRCVSPGDGVCVRALNSGCAELGCDHDRLVPRSRIQTAMDQGHRTPISPKIHFGGVASADHVMKSARHRDSIARQGNVIAFEMEGAGLWEAMPTIAVKGVCDYADSHKNKGWQSYAAATAASCAKDILMKWRPAKTQSRESGQLASSADPSSHLSFSGHFTAGKSIHQGNTYHSTGPMNF